MFGGARNSGSLGCVGDDSFGVGTAVRTMRFLSQTKNFAPVFPFLLENKKDFVPVFSTPFGKTKKTLCLSASVVKSFFWMCGESYFDNPPKAARKIASKFSRPADCTARSTAFSACARW